MGHLACVFDPWRLQEILLHIAETADDAQFEACPDDGPQDVEVDPFPAQVAEEADRAYLSVGGRVLQGSKQFVVHGGSAREGVGPDASRLLEQARRRTRDEVGTQKEFALRLCDVLRRSGEVLVVVRTVVEYEPRVEAGDQAQRRPRRRIGHHDRMRSGQLLEVLQYARDEEFRVRPPEYSPGRRGGERRVYGEVSLGRGF